MNLARLQKQLAKDVKKSPGKAAALGLLTLVALYAWAPLLFREDAASEPAQGNSVVAQTDPTTQGPAASQIAAVHLPASWQQLASWMDNDPRMKSAVGNLERMNPFATLSPPATDAETSDAPGEQNTVSQVVDPRSLGLIVSGTMLGTHRRVAVVNGRPYAEGHQLQLGPDVSFTLAQVGVRHIVLERDGRRFDLPVAEKGSQQSSP